MSQHLTPGSTTRINLHEEPMPKLLRKSEGQPLRDEIKRQGLTLDELAEKTKTVDPEGRGVSPATIGRITGTGASARDKCELWTAWLITDVINRPIQRYFLIPTHSTATVERSRPDAEED